MKAKTHSNEKMYSGKKHFYGKKGVDEQSNEQRPETT